jgi:hypothetical protein
MNFDFDIFLFIFAILLIFINKYVFFNWILSNYHLVFLFFIRIRFFFYLSHSIDYPLNSLINLSTLSFILLVNWLVHLNFYFVFIIYYIMFILFVNHIISYLTFLIIISYGFINPPISISILFLYSNIIFFMNLPNA